MNIEKYIHRINYEGALTQSLEVLKGLQQAHLLKVPFENLNIHYDRPIHLDINGFYNKVVVNGRGGFCYELNGLFNALLKEIGFKTKIISARVYNGEMEAFGKEFDHLAIIVELNQAEYLVDVGFGAFSFHPLKFELGSIQSDPRGDFVIEAYEDGYYKVSKVAGEPKSLEYIFTKKERMLNEFAEMCDYHQTSPNSFFTQKKLISRPTEMGRITITGNTLKVTENGKTIKEDQFAMEDFGKYLLNWFEIEESKFKARS